MTLHSLMHIVKLLQTWLIETEGNMGVMICFYQGGLRSASASSSLTCIIADVVTTDGHMASRHNAQKCYI